MRFSLCYVSFKDRKGVAAGLKAVYRAATAAEAEHQIEAFAGEWDGRYPSISKSWRANWARVTPMFGLPDDIRRAVYTTNAIESLNMSLRKVIKTRASFPNDEAAFKLLFWACRADELGGALHSARTLPEGRGRVRLPQPEDGRAHQGREDGLQLGVRGRRGRGLTFHDLRRTGATRLGEGGANAFYISAVLGHADVKTSEIYTVATNEGLRRAMERLTESPKGSPYLSPAAKQKAAG